MSILGDCGGMSNYLGDGGGPGVSSAGDCGEPVSLTLGDGGDLG